MVSVTHYMDRDGNFLADVSPRRYFCEQCHVVQTDANPLLANEFHGYRSSCYCKTRQGAVEVKGR